MLACSSDRTGIEHQFTGSNVRTPRNLKKIRLLQQHEVVLVQVVEADMLRLQTLEEPSPILATP